MEEMIKKGYLEKVGRRERECDFVERFSGFARSSV
jgi:hypothetical protein